MRGRVARERLARQVFLLPWSCFIAARERGGNMEPGDS